MAARSHTRRITALLAAGTLAVLFTAQPAGADAAAPPSKPITFEIPKVQAGGLRPTQTAAVQGSAVPSCKPSGPPRGYISNGGLADASALSPLLSSTRGRARKLSGVRLSPWTRRSSGPTVAA
jgi:hypothetical protein